MSVFSQKLQALIQPRIDKGQLTIYGLARNSKIDRSSLYKFINGETAARQHRDPEPPCGRTPAKPHASLRTEGCLRYFHAWGRSATRRRRHTLEFLNFFNQYVGTQPAETLPPPEPPPLPSGCSEVRTGVLPVNNLVQAVVGGGNRTAKRGKFWSSHSRTTIS